MGQKWVEENNISTAHCVYLLITVKMQRETSNCCHGRNDEMQKESSGILSLVVGSRSVARSAGVEGGPFPVLYADDLTD